MKNMLSNYFKLKTNTDEFRQQMELTINTLKEKKILVYGAGTAFVELNKQYNLTEKLNIVAITDKKFEKIKCKEFCGIRTVIPDKSASEDFDVIVVTIERYEPIVKFIRDNISIKDDCLVVIFEQKSNDERENLNYLGNLNFRKKLDKLAKKLKNKQVVLYGAGTYLELIFKYFDMSQFNILAIADKRFKTTGECSFHGYKTCNPQNIKSFSPDYVLISTKYYVNIFENLYYDILKNTKIKILPLVDKPLFTLIKEQFFIN